MVPVLKEKDNLLKYNIKSLWKILSWITITGLKYSDRGRMWLPLGGLTNTTAKILKNVSWYC